MRIIVAPGQAKYSKGLWQFMYYQNRVLVEVGELGVPIRYKCPYNTGTWIKVYGAYDFFTINELTNPVKITKKIDLRRTNAS